MANRVLTIFEGKADQLFVTANRVEKRLEDFAKNTSQLQASPAIAAQAVSPVIAQQRQLTAGVKAESEKRVAIEKAAGQKITASAKQNAQTLNQVLNAEANRNAFANILDSKIASDAKQQADILTKAKATRPFTLTPAQALANDRAVEATRNAIRATREAKEAAADSRRLAAKQIAARAEIQSVIRTNIVVNNARRAAFAERAAMDRAETAVVRTEAVKQAAARQASFAGPSTFTGGALRGAGLGRFAAGGPAGIAGLATIGVTALAISTYSKEISEAEGRTKRFNVISRDTGIAQKELAASVEQASRQFRITRQEAEDIIGPIANLAGESRRSFAEVKDAAIDLASARGIDRAQLPNLLNDIAQGSANAALLGKNAASIFDLYADSLGKTADKLTETEKKQALVNRLLSDGAIAAGDAANAVDQQTASFDALGKSLTALLQAGGGAFNLPAKGILDYLTQGLGGDPAFGRFDPSRALQESGFSRELLLAPLLGPAAGLIDLGSGRKGEDIYRDDIEASVAEVQKAHAEVIRRFREQDERFRKALENPNGSVVNRALSRISRETLAGLNVEDRQKLFDSVIADTKEFAGLQVKVYEDEIKRITQTNGGPDAFRGLLRLIEGNKAIIGEGAFRGLSGSISTEIERGAKEATEGFQRQIDAAKDNIPRLRKLLADAYRVPDIPPGDRDRFARTLQETIEKGIEAGRDKVRQLGDAIRGVFDTIGSRAAAGNPFLEFLTAADKRMQELRRNTAGFSGSLRGALAQIEQTSNRRDVIGLRFDARLGAQDLRTQASEFRQGFRNDLSDPAILQKLVDLQLRTLGQSANKGSQFFDINDPRISGQPFSGEFRFLPGQGLPTQDPLQRSISDQRLIGIAGSLDPAKLREDQRRTIAEALEREAGRRLNAEREAQEARAEQVRLLGTIDAELRRLNATAERGGLDAVVRILNESDRARVETRPKAADTAARYTVPF